MIVVDLYDSADLLVSYLNMNTGGSPGVWGKICVIKKGGALENEVKGGRGTLKWGIKVIN